MSKAKNRFRGYCECGDHAWADALHGVTVLVSPEDATLLKEHVWTARLSASARVAHIQRGQGGANRLLHRLILQTDAPHIDHANRNPADNRRSNIRPASCAQNTANRPGAGGTSRFKGVHFDRLHQKWRAEITMHGVRRFLGYFKSETEAALAYDAAASEAFGAFALTNTMMGHVDGGARG